MELYGTFLTVLVLKELRTAQAALSIKDLSERLQRFPQTDDRLNSRLRDALRKAHDQQLVEREVQMISNTKGAYYYSITEQALQQMKVYELS